MMDLLSRRDTDGLSMVAILLLLCCFFSMPAAAATKASVIKKDATGGWYMKADKVPLSNLLMDLQKVSGIRIYGEQKVSERVVADYHYPSLTSLVDALLRPYNHAVIRDEKNGKHRIESIWILKRYVPAKHGEIIDARSADKGTLASDNPDEYTYQQDDATINEKIERARKLAEMDAKMAIPALISLAVDSTPDVVKAAVTSLQEFGALVPGDAIAEAIDKQAVAKSRIMLLMAHFDIPDPDLINITQTDPEPTMRFESLYQLFDKGTSSEKENILNNALKDESPYVRASAMDIQTQIDPDKGAAFQKKMEEEYNAEMEVQKKMEQLMPKSGKSGWGAAWGGGRASGK